MSTTLSITWPQALSWRLRQHQLHPVGTASVAEVVRRLGAVLATDEPSAELAVGMRRTGAQPGELRRAHEAGAVVKSYAFRGAVHYLSPEDGGAYLALRCAGRQWELPSWQDYYRLGAGDWPAFRQTVRDALTDGPLTVAELGAAVTRVKAYRHLRAVFDDGAGTLIKPLMWQGDMSFGPVRHGRATVQGFADRSRWAGIWVLEDAGPHALRSYLHTYGPATREHVDRWFGGGLSAGRRRLQSWLSGLDDAVTVDVEGSPAYLLRADVDALREAEPTSVVQLLPAHDQWVMGIGTDDEQVVPAAHRTAVTRRANLLIAGGVVSGTWTVTGDTLAVSWFAERGIAPRDAVAEQADRLAELIGRPLRTAIEDSGQL